MRSRWIDGDQCTVLSMIMLWFGLGIVAVGTSGAAVAAVPTHAVRVSAGA
jgi:hypothetical protein